MRCIMDHIVLNVRDVEEMILFYSEVLQLGTERLDEYRAGKVPFPSVRLNEDTIIDLFPREMWKRTMPDEPGKQSLNHFCLTLDEIDWLRLREHLERHSIAVIDGPVPRWGAHGTGTSIYFADPEGNTIEARYYQGMPEEESCLLGS